MDDKTWEKYGALGGIWFVVLAVVGSSLTGGSYPDRDDPADILSFFSDNDSAIQIGAFLTGLGVIGLVWWFGSLWRAMGRAEEGPPRVEVIALGGFAFSGAMAFGGFSVTAGTAAVIDSLGEGSAIFYSIASVMFGFAAIGTAILVLAVSGLAMRSGFLPKWLAQGGLVVVAAELLSGVAVASDAPFFGVLGFIAFLVWALWIVGVSLHLYRKAPT